MINRIFNRQFWPSRWFWVRLTLYIAVIGGYYGYNSEYTKAIPALTLIPFVPQHAVQSGLLLAAFGDYFLYLSDYHNNDPTFTIPGILSFAGLHLLLISRTQIHKMHSHLKPKKYLISFWIVLFALVVLISTQCPLILIGPIFVYGQILTALFVSAFAIAAIYHHMSKLIDVPLRWSDLNPDLHHPKSFLVGVIIFIVSDLIVFSQIIGIDLPQTRFYGLPMYWLSLFIIAHTFIQDRKPYQVISIN